MPTFNLPRTKNVPSAKNHNRLIDAILSLRARTDAGGIQGSNTPGGPGIAFPDDDEVLGVITGVAPSGGGYSWSWAAFQSGSWTAYAPGISNAYEINGRTGVPSGHAFVLCPGAAGEKIFQWLRLGTGSGDIERCNVTVCATDCSGNPIPGAVVLITGPGAPTTPSSGIGGCVSIVVGGPGPYVITVSATGFITTSLAATITCGETITVQLQTNPSTACPSITLSGCFAGPEGPGPLSNAPDTSPATLTIDGVTYTADLGGNVQPCLTKPGTFTWTASCPGFDDATGTVTVATPCGVSSGLPTVIQLTPSSGFFCTSGAECFVFEIDGGVTIGSSSFAYPETLSLNDSLYGGATLTYNAAIPGWVGTISGVSVTPCAPSGCAAATTTITYTWNGCLSISYTTNEPTGGFCPGAGPGTNSSGGNTVNGSIAFPLMIQFSVVGCDVGFPETGAANPLYPTSATITITT
jgi:hypothetical protein